MGLFDGLESLGFNAAELSSEDIFKTETVKHLSDSKEDKAPSKDDPMDYLYAKELECPVCGKSFVNHMTRKSRLRLQEMELDMKTNFYVVNANCYDVFLCPHCGYAALINQFNLISDKQKDIVLTKIMPQFKAREYPVPLSFPDAAERYKLALFCAVTIGTKAGIKAIICLKTAWVYRDMKDRENELLFLNAACTGLQEAYKTETFPIGAMDEQTVMFMIGELSRRVGLFTEASKWISNVILARGVKKNLKERAMDVKDLIRAGTST